jgi:hypothetical protein
VGGGARVQCVGLRRQCGRRRAGAVWEEARGCSAPDVTCVWMMCWQRFAHTYLASCMHHLNTVLRVAAPFDRSNVFANNTPLERGIVFAALGNLAKSMASPTGVAGLTPHLQTVAAAMKEIFLKRKKGGISGCTEAIVCAGQLAQYLGAPWEAHVAELVDPLFHTGLTPNLVGCLPLSSGCGGGGA